MTAKESSAWLEYRARVTGLSVEEIRQQMAERGAKADKSKSGFASRSPEKRLEISLKGVAARRKKRDERVE